MKEIERKWLLKKVPDRILSSTLPELIHQGYLSTEPEIRIRFAFKLYSGLEYYMTLKSNGNMVRDETEIDLQSNQFQELADSLTSAGYKLITKDKYKYTHEFYNNDNNNDDNISIEVNVVDKGTDNEFIYAEVEFKDEAAANKYELPYWLEVEAVEVTNNQEYKMKNYWKRTRLNK